MALSLGVAKNDKFYVGDIPVEVLEASGHTFAKILVQGKTFALDDKQSVEILPRVFVSCGKPSAAAIASNADLMDSYRASALARAQLSPEEASALPPVPPAHELLPRLLIDAPRSITILRETLYVRDKKSTQAGV